MNDSCSASYHTLEKIDNRLSDFLETSAYDILTQWMLMPNVRNTLRSNGISPGFFAKHFGIRILNYFISVARTNVTPGECPTIMVMMKFFAQNQLRLDQIFLICSGKRMTILSLLLENGFCHADPEFQLANELFDLNFSGVIREYQLMHCEARRFSTEEAYPSCPIETTPVDEQLLMEYFKPSADDVDAVVIQTDDADEIIESFYDISERLHLAALNSDLNEIDSIAASISRIASILLHYTPYLDTLAASLSELSLYMNQHKTEFMTILHSGDDGLFRLFDAVNADMERYVQRFMIESIAMENIHHIHEPTSLSIRQIIALCDPGRCFTDEIEFF